jgi:uncharacterized membrane protein
VLATTFYAALKVSHVLAITLWVGGMAFAHLFLRPSLSVLEPPQRLRLMQAVLGRFFFAVALAAGITVASGLWMISELTQSVRATGGSLHMPLAWTAMAAIGLLMAAIFLYIRLRLFPRFGRAMDAGDMPLAATALVPIRAWVLVNLVLGVTVLVLVSASHS